MTQQLRLTNRVTSLRFGLSRGDLIGYLVCKCPFSQQMIGGGRVWGEGGGVWGNASEERPLDGWGWGEGERESAR